MIKVFKGNDPKYQEEYNILAKLWMEEHGIGADKLAKNAQYIYWENKEYFARAGAQITFDWQSHQYVLTNLITFVDFSLYHNDVEVDYEEGIDRHHLVIHEMESQFYQALYAKVCQLFKDQGSLLLQLEHEEFWDCLTLGGWPCKEVERISKGGEEYYQAMLDLSATGLKKFKYNLKNDEGDVDILWKDPSDTKNQLLGHFLAINTEVAAYV